MRQSHIEAGVPMCLADRNIPVSPLRAKPSNIPSVLISTEMSGTALTKRLIANICNITGEALLTGRLTRDEWDYYRQQSSVISACPLYIFDTSYLTLRITAGYLVRRGYFFISILQPGASVRCQWNLLSL